MPSLVQIGQVVSEEKIEMQIVEGLQTQDGGQPMTLAHMVLRNRWAKTGAAVCVKVCQLPAQVQWQLTIKTGEP